jgi:hypothetical protein
VTTASHASHDVHGLVTSRDLSSAVVPKHRKSNVDRIDPHLTDAHEWVSFDDPDEERTWVFDVTFLASTWHCIYGNGCPGISEEGPAPEKMIGCCEHGAYFVDEEDLETTKKYVEQLDPEDWQFHGLASKRGWWFTQKDGTTKTRVVDGGCIFQNRKGFAGGAGCALHNVAVSRGEKITDWKPDVCWQAPLRQHDSVDEYGRVTSMVREWKRRDWGPAGEDFHWWCVDSPEAFRTKKKAPRVYEHSRDELVEMCGARVYGLLKAELDRRRDAGVTLLPHPTLRR